MGRQERVGLGVPYVVVDPVKDSAEFVLVLFEDAAEPGRAVIVQRLVGVAGGHRGDKVRVHHAALHRVQAPVAEVIP
jgi:hypothetical protein